MKDIAIYGAGGFGKEVACLIDRINKAETEPKWNLIGFFDDGKPVGEQVSHHGVVLGGIDVLNNWVSPLDLAIAIGTPSSLMKVAEHIKNGNIHFPNLVDKSFYVIDKNTLTIGRGNIIQGPGSVSCDVLIGNFNDLNGGVVIGHDTQIGNYNAIMPSCRISGEVKIGDCNLLGTNSIVIQQLKIGNGVTLGAGSVLMAKPKNGFVYIGVPAKRFKF